MVYPKSRSLSLLYFSSDITKRHPRKCLKWIPNKKSAIGDKLAVKKNHPALRWDALPFAARRILTLEDVTSQQEMVRVLLINYATTDMWIVLASLGSRAYDR